MALLKYIHFTKHPLCINSFNLSQVTRMIERSLFSPDHEAFRDAFRRFMEKEIAPFHEQWEEQGYVCLLYTSPSPRDRQKSRMPSSA